MTGHISLYSKATRSSNRSVPGVPNRSMIEQQWTRTMACCSTASGPRVACAGTDFAHGSRAFACWDLCLGRANPRRPISLSRAAHPARPEADGGPAAHARGIESYEAGDIWLSDEKAVTKTWSQFSGSGLPCLAMLAQRYLQ